MEKNEMRKCERDLTALECVKNALMEMDAERIVKAQYFLHLAESKLELQEDAESEESYRVIPFDLATAQEHPDWVYTHKGNKVRLLCFDRKVERFPLVGLIDKKEYETLICYGKDGVYCEQGQVEDNLVLRKPIRRVQKWVVSEWDCHTDKRNLFG